MATQAGALTHSNNHSQKTNGAPRAAAGASRQAGDLYQRGISGLKTGATEVGSFFEGKPYLGMGLAAIAGYFLIGALIPAKKRASK